MATSRNYRTGDYVNKWNQAVNNIKTRHFGLNVADIVPDQGKNLYGLLHNREMQGLTNDFTETILSYLSELRNADNTATNNDILLKLLESLVDNDVKREQRAYDESAMQEQRVYDQSVLDEQRAYNESIRDEQRIYDSPINQLARLQAAGVGRDSAIGLLGGSDSGSSAVGSPGLSDSPSVIGSGSQSSAPGITDRHARENEVSLKTVDSLMNAFATIASLGFGAAGAVSQIRASEAQSFMSDSAREALQYSSEIGRFFTTALSSGVMSQQEYKSLRNGSDVRDYLLNNRTRPDVKPIFDSGAFNGVFGTPNGLGMFNQYWHDEHDTRSFGDIYQEELKQTKLRSYLGQVQCRDEYANMLHAWNQLVKDDAEIQAMYQDFLAGNLKLSILGNEVKISDERVKVAELEGYEASVDKKIAQNIFENFNVNGQTGIDFMSYGSFSDLWEYYENAAVRHADPDKLHKLLENNFDAAFAISVLEKKRQEFASNAHDDEKADNSWIQVTRRFMDAMNWSGATPLIQFGGNAAVNYLTRRAGRRTNIFINGPGQQ